jgi:hypothetical protein
MEIGNLQTAAGIARRVFVRQGDSGKVASDFDSDLLAILEGIEARAFPNTCNRTHTPFCAIHYAF